MIAVLGATGYTGRLLAAELAARGLAHRRGARDPARLATLPRAPQAETFVVDAADASRLDAFLDGAETLVTTVGPFTRLGMPVVEAAVRNGVTYVDSAGEPAFIEAVYERFATAPVPVVPACGFEFVAGDLAAAVAAADVGEATEVAVAYELSGVWPSRGTVRTALGMVASSKVSPAERRIRFPEGPRRGVEVTWGERVTVPRHVPGATVSTLMVAGRPAAAVAGVGLTALRLATPLVTPVVDLLPPGPSERRRRRGRFRVVVEARGRGRRRSSVVCEGHDVYGLTARFLVEAAVRVGGAGALAPAQALDPEHFLDAVSGAGFAWRRF